MKYIKFIICIIVLVFFFGCNDDFMNRYPTDSIIEQNFWKTTDELKEYVNSLYPLCKSFAGHGTYHDMSPMLTGDNQSDNLVPLNYNNIAAGEYVVPPTGGGWDFNFIRRCNYFLTRYNKTPVPQNEKDIYAGEVKVFKALEYFRLVKRFGDVPWLSKDLSTTSKALYAPRDSRALVIDSIVKDLDWAIDKLPSKQNAEPDRINRDVALAVKARICLYEGTWEKYHQGDPFGVKGQDGRDLLKEAFNASDTLIREGHYRIYNTGHPASDYQALFSSLDLSGNPEMILYRKYDINLLGTRTDQYVQDNAMNNGASKSLVDDYLCNDGLPISMSPHYLGDDSIEAEMKNRDPRLTQTIVYPRTNQQKGLPGPPIPGTSFGGSSLGAGLCPTGYQILKYWVPFNQEEYLRIQNGILDAPIIRYAEVLLIYAEAAAELGVCDQNILDESINLLRERVGMPHMEEAKVMSWAGNPKYHLDYNNITSPLINEIRRERRVELAIENFRYDDLMRWKEGKLLEERLLGMKFIQKDYPDVVVGEDIFLDNNRFIWPYSQSLPGGRKFDENKNYLFPLPTEELVLNPKLKQNPGW